MWLNRRPSRRVFPIPPRPPCNHTNGVYGAAAPYIGWQRQERRENGVSQIEAFAKAGMGAVVFFVICCVFMHFIQPDLSPVHAAVSYYMNGRLGWVLSL